MGESENIQVYRRLIEGLSDGRLEVLDELIDPAVTIPTAPPPFEPSLAGLREANAWVAARITWTGTNDGELMGNPPTGKRVAISEIEIVRIVDGRIVDLRQVADFASLLAQLG